MSPKCNGKIMRLVLFLLLLAFSVSGVSKENEFEEGVDYFILDESVPEWEGKVIEFFNYACVYCFRAEGGVKEAMGLLHGDIILEKVPVVLGKGERFRTGGIIAVIAEKAGLMESYHDYMFQLTRAPIGWELKKYNRLSSVKDAKIFFQDIGVSEEKFQIYLDEAYKILEKNEDIAKRIGIAGTPSIIVNGRYLVMGLKSIPYSEKYLRDIIVYLARIN